MTGQNQCDTGYVRDRAWFMRLYGEIIDRTDGQTMLCLTCTMISSVDLAHYEVSRAKDCLYYESNQQKEVMIG